MRIIIDTLVIIALVACVLVFVASAAILLGPLL